MAYRVLEVTIQSAKDLKRVNLISRMEVYAVVTISGDPMTRQSTPPDPYGGRHPCWNATFRFNVPPTATVANGCLHVLLRTERALGDRDVGEVIVSLADILAGTTAGDPGPRPQQCAAYQVRKVHRCEPRGTLNVSYRLGPVVAPQQAPPAKPDEHGPVVAYPMAPPFYPSPYGYLPPTLSLPPPPTQAAGGHDAVHQHPPSTGPINAYNFPACSQAAAGHDAVHPPAPSAGPFNKYNNNPAYSQAAAVHDAVHPPAPSAGPFNKYNNNPAYSQAAAGHDAVHPPAPSAGPFNTYNNNPAYSQAAAGYAALPPTKGNKSDGNVDFGVGLGAGLVSGAIGGMLASDMMAEAAAYSYGYRAGLADGGGAAAMYKNSHVPNKAQDKVESKRAMV